MHVHCRLQNIIRVENKQSAYHSVLNRPFISHPIVCLPVTPSDAPPPTPPTLTPSPLTPNPPIHTVSASAPRRVGRVRPHHRGRFGSLLLDVCGGAAVAPNGAFRVASERDDAAAVSSARRHACSCSVLFLQGVEQFVFNSCCFCVLNLSERKLCRRVVLL